MHTSIVLLEYSCSYPGAHGPDSVVPCPTGCLMSRYIAARLAAQDTPVRIERMPGREIGVRECADRVVAGDGDLLGVHARYCREHTVWVFELLAAVKALRPEMRVFLYGYFATFAWREILRDCPQVDWIVCNEPEQTCAELAAARGEVLAVAGIARRDNGVPVPGAVRAVAADLDALPFPFRGPGDPGGAVTLLGSRGRADARESSRSSIFYGTTWRGRSPANIAAEVADLQGHPALPRVIFADEDFFGPGRAGQVRAREIAERIRDFSLEFELTCCPAAVEETTLAALARAGLRRVRLDMGQADLIANGRDACSRGLEVLRCHGVEPVPCCVLVEPDSSLEDAGRGFEFLRQHRLLQQLSVTLDVLGHRRVVLRGMPLFRHLERQGRLSHTGPLGYEGMYRCADARAELLAESIGTVCGRVCGAAAYARSTIRPEAPQNATGAQINAILVNAFAELVDRFGHGARTDPGAVQAVTEDLVGQIEGALVEARVCQS